MTVEGTVFLTPNKRGGHISLPESQEGSGVTGDAGAVFQLHLGRKAVITLAAVLGNVGFATVSLIVNYVVH